VIGILGPEPIQPLTIARDIPPDIASTVRECFLSMHETEEGREAMGRIGIKKYVEVKPEFFDGVRDYFAPLYCV